MLDVSKWPWLKNLSQSRWFHPLLLLVWIAVGTGLRFSRLEMKPIWTDEFATIVFSLGNTFHTVPLDRVLGLDTLLQPLQSHANLGIGGVINRLFRESTHPPGYFVLAHLWLKLFPLNEGLTLLWASRALSALFGVASIPAMFGLGWLAFRSRLVGQLAAAMMAVSPFGVSLAQEARHYTLAILLVIASLSCFVVAIESLEKRSPLPVWVGLIWVAVNSLGIAVHYFFALTLIAEGLVLLALWMRNWQFLSHSPTLPLSHSIAYWWRILAVAAGTLAGGLVWFPVWQDIKGNELTKWVYEGDPVSNFLWPIVRFFLWAIAMVSLLPIDILNLPLTIASVVVTAIFLIWFVRIIWRGFRLQIKQPNIRLGMMGLGGYVLGMLLLIFGFTYGLGMDLTLAPRFQYNYFPSAIALLAATLAYSVKNQNSKVVEIKEDKRFIQIFSSFSDAGWKRFGIIWLMGFIGAITVILNLDYLQHERGDMVAQIIQKESQSPVLIATTHKHHGQTGRMMGIAWEFKRLNLSNSVASNPQFLLAHIHQGWCYGDLCNDPEKNPASTLPETVATLPRPLDVWLLNFHAPELLESHNCTLKDRRSLPKVEGYRVRHYQCYS